MSEKIWNDYNILGVTLARGGSKGIPRKNIKKILGKPLIGYTIEAALQSKIFNHYIVSTDDKEIAEISKNFGAKIPFMRPDYLAGDEVWSRDALKHAVLECEKIYDTKYDFIFELPCVAPARTSKHIQEVLNRLVDTSADSVISLTQMQDKHPVRMKRLVNGEIRDFCKEFPEGEGSRRQELEPCYIRNGAIYSMKRDTIVKNFSRNGNKSIGYIMNDLSSVNIDTPVDLLLAESILKRKI